MPSTVIPNSVVPGPIKPAVEEKKKVDVSGWDDDGDSGFTDV